MKRFLIWVLAVFNMLIVLVRLIAGEAGLIPNAAPFGEVIGFVVTAIVLSIMGALIVVRTDGNRVGWLMLVLGFSLANPFQSYIELNYGALQYDLGFDMILAVWAQGWLFFLVIFAVFFIIFHYPTGYPPTPRWNWVNLIAITAFAQFVVVYTFQPQYGDASLRIDNPYAMLPVSAEDTISGLVFGLGMIFLAVSSLVSMIIRFRRAEPLERAQIKWLLFAAGFFFAAIGYRLATYDPNIDDWTDYLLVISLLIMTISISLAILRFRLYDIDFLIRKTLQYALLTGILLSVYFGGVVILQGVFEGLIGTTESPLVTVITTLVIAGLFSPLRKRTQDWIDRRFYRAKYDAVRALDDFAMAARDEVDLARLVRGLIRMVDDTLKPEALSLWLDEGEEKSRSPRR